MLENASARGMIAPGAADSAPSDRGSVVMSRIVSAKPAGRRRSRAALLAGVAAAAIALAGLEIETPSFSVSVAGEGRITVGGLRIDGGLVSAALAQQGGSVTLEDVVFESMTATVRIPSITFEGTSLGREALRQAITATGDRPAADLLADIDARLVTIPEAIIEQTVQGRSQRIVYSAVEARDVTAGMIAHLSVESATVEDTGDSSVAVAIGETVVEGFDLPGTVRFYTQAAAAGEDNPMRTLYESFRMTDMRARDAEGVEVRVGEIAGTGFRARLLSRPFVDLVQDLDVAGDPRRPSREETRAAMAFVVDLYRAFEVGGFVVRDMSAFVPELGGEVFSIARIGFGDEASDGGFEIEDIAFSAEEVDVAIERFYSAGFSIEATLDGLAALVENEDLDDVDPETLRALMPSIGRFGFEGVSAEIVPEDDDEPISFTLAGLHFVGDEPVSGVPSFVSMRMDELAFSIPKTAEDDAARTLLDLGYGEMNLSASLAARWDQAAEVLAVEELAFSGRDMGRLAVTGRLGGVGPGILSGDEAVILATLMGATAERLTIGIEDEGLAARVLEQQAREQGVPPQVLQEQSAMMATAMLPMMMGNTPQARELGAALGAFVARPGALDIALTARDSDGIPLVALADLTDPTALLALIDIAASAR